MKSDTDRYGPIGIFASHMEVTAVCSPTEITLHILLYRLKHINSGPKANIPKVSLTHDDVIYLIYKLSRYGRRDDGNRGKRTGK